MKIRGCVGLCCVIFFAKVVYAYVPVRLAPARIAYAFGSPRHLMPCAGRHKDSLRMSKRATLSGVSLDRPLLSGVYDNLYTIPVRQLVVAVTVLLALTCLRSLSDYLDTTSPDLNDRFPNIISNVREGFYSLLRSVAGAVQIVCRKVKWPVKNIVISAPILSDVSWSVCSLENVEQVDADWNKYTFSFSGRLGDRLGLDVGEQVILSTLTASGRAIKKRYYPVSSPGLLGRFEVMGRRGVVEVAKADRDVDLALQFMQPGEEVAVKKGERTLWLPEGEDDVRRLSVVASGTGLFPTLQLLRGVLEQSELSSVEGIDLLWINDGKREFVLNAEVEDLQRRFEAGNRLSVTRVVDRELGNANTVPNEQLKEALPRHRAGTVGLIMAEGVVADKLLRLFASRGYPTDSIAQLGVAPSTPVPPSAKELAETLTV